MNLWADLENSQILGIFWCIKSSWEKYFKTLSVSKKQKQLIIKQLSIKETRSISKTLSYADSGKLLLNDLIKMKGYRVL